MAVTGYKRPPITEAVLELRLSTQVPVNVLEKVKNQLSEEYPAPPQIIQNISIRPGNPPPPPVIEIGGFRLTSGDGANVCVLGAETFAVSRLAPYDGWEAFVAKARDHWELLRKTAGWQGIQRVGVRYINRIDIPNPNDEPVQIDKFLNFRPVFPEFEGAQGVENFAINGVMAIAESNLRVILNAGTAVSPLVKTTSFLVDIDISREEDLPKNDPDLWSLIEKIRPLKNRIFEASITDDARRLFSS